MNTTTIESPRTCSYIPRNIKAVLLPQVSSRDVTAVNVKCNTGRGEKQLVIASVYLPLGAHEPCPTWELANLVNHCDTGDINIIIGTDANAHCLLWESKDTKDRGRALAEYLLETNLEILNRGCEPSFVTSRSQSVIDITLATWDISQYIMEWHVSKEVSLSDHKWIVYTLRCIVIETKTYRNPRLTNWALYNEELEDRLGTFVQSIPIEYKSTEDRENLRKKAWAKVHRRLSLFQSGQRKLFDSAKNTKKTEDSEAKEHRKEFKKELRKRKRETWRFFCSDITSTASATRLSSENSLEGLHTSTRFPKDRGSHLYSHLRRVRRTFTADYVSRQHKDYLPFQKGCIQHSTFPEGLSAGGKGSHGGKTGLGSEQLFPI
ncbi:uncharacterized protein LOC135126664 [Zophobas morio]|uniref:uncharacterized protein LOC135126664 n=1 Tax=Zophobas morio TaxID=2755281 RepID=UPI003082B2AD